MVCCRTACDDGGVVATSASRLIQIVNPTHNPQRSTHTIVNRKSKNRKFYRSLCVLCDHLCVKTIHYQLYASLYSVRRRGRRRHIGFALPTTHYHLPTLKAERIPLLPFVPSALAHYPLPTTIYQLSKRKGFRFSLSVPSALNLNPQLITLNSQRATLNPPAIVNRKSKIVNSTNYQLPSTN